MEGGTATNKGMKKAFIIIFCNIKKEEISKTEKSVSNRNLLNEKLDDTTDLGRDQNGKNEETLESAESIRQELWKKHICGCKGKRETMLEKRAVIPS